MSTAAPSPHLLDLDELFTGACRGWLAGTCTFALWYSAAPCACELGRIGTFLALEGMLSLWFAGLVVLVGLPSFHFLGRLHPSGSPVTWGAIGATSFGLACVGLATLVAPVSDGDVVLLAVLAAISGGTTLYLVKRRSDRRGDA